MQKLFITVLLISFYSISFSNQLSEEDIKIKELKKQISLLNKEVKKLEAQKLEKIKTQKKSPKVALVLSGGGAKGFAHVGVLKVLEENNINIDYITGSSMGAIIAALYSSGYTPTEIENILSDMDWEAPFNSNPNREDIPLDEKAIAKNYGLSIKYDKEFNFSFPKSLRNSQRAYLFLKKLLWKVENIKDFDKLPIPLRIIATDLNTGNAKTFKTGDLAQVITASMAIPTIFDPVKIDDNYYVDALLSRNFPVQDALDLGADIVIGVDVGSSVKDREDYNIISVMDQIVAIQSASSTPKQRSLATVLISPDVSKYKSTDLSSFKAIESAGEIAAREKLPDILSFPISKKEVKNKITPTPDQIVIKNIEIKSDVPDENHQEIIKSVFKNYTNTPVNVNTLDNLMLKLYGFQFINKVYYEVKGDTLHLNIEKSPSNTVGFGFNYETNYGTTFSIGTDINKAGKYGTLSSIEATFGDYLGLEFNNFFYYGVSNKIGILFNMEYDESPFNLYENKNRISEFKNKTFSIRTGLLTQYDNKLLFAYGLSMNYSRLIQDLGVDRTKILNYSKSYGELFLSLSWDRTNFGIYSSSGTRGTIQYTWGGQIGEDSLNYSSPVYLLEGYIPVTKKLSLTSSFFGGTVTGEEILPDKYIKLGGIRNNTGKKEFAFTGYYFQQKLLESLFGASVGIQYEMFSNVYLIGKYNLATFQEPSLKYDLQKSALWEEYHQGYGIGIGYRSIIGPIEFSLSRNNSNHETLAQLSIGYSFD